MSSFSDRNAKILCLLLLALLIVEILALATYIAAPSLNIADDSPIKNPFLKPLAFVKTYWQGGLWILGACGFSLTPHAQPIFNRLSEQSQNNSSYRYLIFHLANFVLFGMLSGLIFAEPNSLETLSITLFSAWTIAGTGTAVFWLLAFAPFRFWLFLIREYAVNLLAGLLLGICAVVLLEMFVKQEAPLAQKTLWDSLSGLTLQIVYSLLRFFYSGLIYQPESLVLGTSKFSVEITYACSGIEGISLITIFIVVYLWLFRQKLRFPQVFWLFPIGILTIWLANAFRIALLIAVGSSFSSEVAAEGFHTQAGWIFFTIISLGLVTLTHRLPFFAAAFNAQSKFSSQSSPLAFALLTPFLIQTAASMITSALSAGFDLLYPVKIVFVVFALLYFINTYKTLDWSWSWEAPVIGTIIFIVWIGLAPGIETNGATLSLKLQELPYPTAALWLSFRVVGSVIVVPLAEELAFRSYLTRKLIAKNFEDVSLRSFTWFSFLGSSIIFGLLHNNWIAAILAGMAYAAALYRHGRIGDSVVAHMTTNALIAFFVLCFGRWPLWA